MLGEGAKVFFAANEFGFGAFAMLAFFGFLDRAANGRGEAFEFVFENVIGGPAAEALNGSVFANGPARQMYEFRRRLSIRGLNRGAA